MNFGLFFACESEHINLMEFFMAIRSRRASRVQAAALSQSIFYIHPRASVFEKRFVQRRRNLVLLGTAFFLLALYMVKVYAASSDAPLAKAEHIQHIVSN